MIFNAILALFNIGACFIVLALNGVENVNYTSMLTFGGSATWLIYVSLLTLDELSCDVLEREADWVLKRLVLNCIVATFLGVSARALSFNITWAALNTSCSLATSIPTLIFLYVFSCVVFYFVNLSYPWCLHLFVISIFCTKRNWVTLTATFSVFVFFVLVPFSFCQPNTCCVVLLFGFFFFFLH